jgi:GNAT superfamily N-acetyltransferase
MAKTPSYKLIYQETATVEEESTLVDGINAEAHKTKQMGKMTPFAFFIKDEKGVILAGAKGVTYYGCLYIDSLWVNPLSRKKGWGSQLMQAAEKLGRERGCRFATLGTMDWEARPFYEKLGYQIEFIREGYDKNSKMYILRKSLI